MPAPQLPLADWAEDEPPLIASRKLRLEAEPEDDAPAGGLYYDAGGGLMIGAQGRLGGRGGPRALVGLKFRF